MNIIVQKYGGSLVADNEKLLNVCHNIKNEKNKDNALVVVVSAQGKTTDKLLAEISSITYNPNKREEDVLISTGEQIAVSKLTMCLEKEAIPAISYLGWQVPIITDSTYGDANIISINTTKIMKELKDNKIVVVAGFQGIDKNNNITTLGRDGSDLTAVSLAIALNANQCEIFKEVDGIYNKDPQKDNQAKKYNQISYDQMLNLANHGSKVLHHKCIKLAKDNNLKIIVKAIGKSNGTIVG